MKYSLLPIQQGLYDPSREHDACGVGFVAHIKGKQSHNIVRQGLQILENLAHRGAVGADPLAGDGAGILIQIPDALLRKFCVAQDILLPAAGEYGVGMLFLPRDTEMRATCERVIADVIIAEGQILLGWRDVPVSNDGLGESVKAVEPMVRQVLVGRGVSCTDTDSFDASCLLFARLWSMQCVSSLTGMGKGSMSPPCPHVPLCIKVCCWPIKWADIILTFKMRVWSVR